MEPVVPERRKVGSGNWLGEKGWAATAMDLGQEVESSWFERWEGGIRRRVDTHGRHGARGGERWAPRGHSRRKEAKAERRGIASIAPLGEAGTDLGAGRRCSAMGEEGVDWEWPGRRLAGRGAARRLARRGAAALWIQGSSGEGHNRRS